ncbi:MULTISPECIES: efflux RND transporter periplasmic adaptor subunit [unclassified Thioalkalivibrio]|uniref:efflux RND transporter periplasmic adaptor subunit n=1 Tax=unclassified Thioalkalivibrio TaxID=2621013 RepID=UPI0003667AC4|nr:MULTISPECIES: efflux RND transporter periplasmic adaptor subunit [unclassified Thioalkalivibrio]
MSIDRLIPDNPGRRLLSVLACSALLMLTSVGAAAEDNGALAGQLDWGQTYRITAPVAGKVQAIEVRPGEHVDQDAALFRLDTRRVEADLRAAQAAIERLQLELDEANREVGKAEDLYDQTLIALREVELARIQQATVAARLAEARAQRDRARADRDDATVRAPASGRITRIDVSPGQFVNPALAPAVLAILGHGDTMRARALVAPDRIDTLTEGQEVTIFVGEYEFSGTIDSIGWELVGEDEDQGYRIEAEFSPGDDAVLRPGQPARIELRQNS